MGHKNEAMSMSARRVRDLQRQSVLSRQVTEKIGMDVEGYCPKSPLDLRALAVRVDPGICAFALLVRHKSENGGEVSVLGFSLP
jgi:hypothetical protein